MRVTPILRVRYWAEYFGLRALAGISRRLPRGVLAVLGDFLGRAAYYLDGSGRKVALENLRCALSECDEPERARIAKRSYQCLGRTFLHLFWSRNLARDDWREHVEIEEEEPGLFDRYNAEGAIWVTAHFGNFEWSSLACGLLGGRFLIVAQSFRNARLTPLFQGFREVTGQRIIPQERSMIRLFKALKKGEGVALLTDLNVPLSQSPSIIDCFGLKTCVTSLHSVLAQRTGRPVVPVLCSLSAKGGYRVRFYKPLRFSEETQAWKIGQTCWDVFEREVKENPEQWIWMYKHWRYRPDGAEVERYPNYANPKRKFDRILSAQN